MTYRWGRIVARASTLSGREWLALASASWELLSARIVFARLSSKELMDRLGSHGNGIAKKGIHGVGTHERLGRLGWAIRAAASVLPWRTDCLVQCLAAHSLIQRYGHVPDFFLGVSKTSDGNLAAHAWLKCHDVAIVGGEGEEFAVLLDPANRPTL